MPFLLMLFLTLACLPDHWPEPAAWVGTPAVSVGLTWLGVVLEVGLAWWLTRQARRRAGAGVLSQGEQLQRYFRGRLLHQCGLFVTYSLGLYVFGYGWAVHTYWRHDGLLLPLPELLLLAPFFTAQVLSWALFYDAEKALHGEPDPQTPGRWSYVGFHVRQNLALVLLPVLLLLVQKEVVRQLPSFGESWQLQAFVGGPVAAVLVFVTLPWIMRVLLGLKPLPDGPVRRRLEAAAKRLRFRCSDILVWDTRGGVANAMVVGVLPWLRYVMFSDRLLAELTPEEVEAVFGHEVGHVRHHHMLLYLFFLLGSMGVLGVVLAPYEKQLEGWFSLRGRHDLAVLPALASLGAYIFLVFGFLSRRCERQADVHGCRAVSCGQPGCTGHLPDQPLPDGPRELCPTGILTFIQALEKVAFLNGINREKPGFLQSWQHSTVARRVQFLQAVLRDPTEERRFQRRILLVKCALFAALGVLLGWQFVS